MKAKLIIYCIAAIFLGAFLVYIPLISLVTVQRSAISSTGLGNMTGYEDLRDDRHFAAGIPVTYLPLILSVGCVAGLVVFYKAKERWK